MRTFAAGHSKQQPDDPAKLAKLVFTVAAVETPPLRLPIGKDAVQRIEDKNRAVASELAAWREAADPSYDIVTSHPGAAHRYEQVDPHNRRVALELERRGEKSCRIWSKSSSGCRRWRVPKGLWIDRPSGAAEP